jgi:hypothetical protein
MAEDLGFAVRVLHPAVAGSGGSGDHVYSHPPRSAHLLLQVRTRVLNDDLSADFARWYPGFAALD